MRKESHVREAACFSLFRKTDPLGSPRLELQRRLTSLVHPALFKPSEKSKKYKFNSSKFSAGVACNCAHVVAISRSLKRQKTFFTTMPHLFLSFVEGRRKIFAFPRRPYEGRSLKYSANKACHDLQEFYRSEGPKSRFLQYIAPWNLENMLLQGLRKIRQIFYSSMNYFSCDIVDTRRLCFALPLLSID